MKNFIETEKCDFIYEVIGFTNNCGFDLYGQSLYIGD